MSADGAAVPSGSLFACWPLRDKRTWGYYNIFLNKIKGNFEPKAQLKSNIKNQNAKLHIKIQKCNSWKEIQYVADVVHVTYALCVRKARISLCEQEGIKKAEILLIPMAQVFY